MTLAEALRDAAQQLSPVSDTARLDAELLMAHALGVTREAMLLGGLGGPVPDTFAALVARRLAHEPLAYITGSRDFWTLTLEVAPSVLIPRPDSETLIEAAVEYFNPPRACSGRWPSEGLTEGQALSHAPPPPFRRSSSQSKLGEDMRILDLGTGSGALLLAALSEFPAAAGLGVDVSPEALAIAQRNATRLGLASRVAFRTGNWAETIAETFDLILCNPPYVETGAALAPELAHEPASALYAGADGLDAYRRLIPQLPALIAPGGMIAVEIGSTQADAVSALFAANGLAPEIRRDLAGRPRAIVHFALGKPVDPV